MIHDLPLLDLRFSSCKFACFEFVCLFEPWVAAAVGRESVKSLCVDPSLFSSCRGEFLSRKNLICCRFHILLKWIEVDGSRFVVSTHVIPSKAASCTCLNNFRVFSVTLLEKVPEHLVCLLCTSKILGDEFWDMSYQSIMPGWGWGGGGCGGGECNSVGRASN